MQGANASLKAAMAQQEAHVKELHAQAEAKAAESSHANSRKASERAAQHAQQVACMHLAQLLERKSQWWACEGQQTKPCLRWQCIITSQSIKVAMRRA